MRKENNAKYRKKNEKLCKVKACGKINLHYQTVLQRSTFLFFMPHEYYLSQQMTCFLKIMQSEIKYVNWKFKTFEL